MTKLSDIQSILLSTASRRDDGSLLPAPDAAGNDTARLNKALAALVRRGLAEERESSDPATIHRPDGDLGFGLFITETGRAAIGLGDGEEERADTPPPAKPARAGKTSPAPTKTATVVALLQREGGATLAELIAATDWLPHTTRAALTGLRKTGQAIERSKRGEETCYRITASV